jgi:hypothetical protein
MVVLPDHFDCERRAVKTTHLADNDVPTCDSCKDSSLLRSHRVISTPRKSSQRCHLFVMRHDRLHTDRSASVAMRANQKPRTFIRGLSKRSAFLKGARRNRRDGWSIAKSPPQPCGELAARWVANVKSAPLAERLERFHLRPCRALPSGPVRTRPSEAGCRREARSLARGYRRYGTSWPRPSSSASAPR